MKDKATKVKEWCTKNPLPVQKLCPDFYQYMKTSKGYEMWNPRTGIRKVIDWNPNRWSENDAHGIYNVYTSRSYEYEGLYIRYIKQLDALEMSHVTMEGNRGQDGVTREWTYGGGRVYYSYQSRLFLFHNDANAYTESGEILEGGKFYSKGMLERLHDWQRKSMAPQEEGLAELRKFDGNARILRSWGGERMFGWDYIHWYEKCFMDRSTSKRYLELTDYELEDIDVPCIRHGDKRAYYRKLDEKNCVLRIYDSPWVGVVNGEYPRNPAEELCRVFISNKGKVTIMVKEYNWVIKAAIPWTCNGKMTIMNKKEMFQWKPLKYIEPCFSMKQDIYIGDIITILRHPIIEQLYKAGYPKMALYMLQRDGIPSFLRDYFLVEKEKKQPLFKLLGCNKFLLKAIEDSADDERYVNINMPTPDPAIAKEVKYFYGKKDVSDATEEVINMIAKYRKTDSYAHISDLCPGKRIRGYYGRNFDMFADPLTDEDRKWILKLLRMEKKHDGCIRLYKDVISTYNQIQNKPEIELYDVRDYEDMQRMHDALVALLVREQGERRAMYNANEAEKIKIREKAFEKRQEERIEKFEYENDDWCICVPKQLDEITREGIILHHCVGGYVDRHALGETNIIFLRHKENADEPFFTIEITNDNHVVQIHGSHNRWLGNEPDAVPFMYTYLEQLGADYDKKLLLNKGAGYSAGSENLDESYLKIIA